MLRIEDADKKVNISAIGKKINTGITEIPQEK